MGKNLIIANSFFEHKDEHKFTREDDTRNERSIIDYILIERQHRKLIKGVKLERNVELSTDHFMVNAKLRNEDNVHDTKMKKKKIQ